MIQPLLPKDSSGSRERLFAGFVDPVDGTCCVSASANARELEELGREHRLRFPLILDAEASLAAQVAASTHAPASSRFGPFCDNILGMNWRLPSGVVVRVGERVAKTTTGYDWLRFLLHSGSRFGVPADFVLRLRPRCGNTRLAWLTPESGKLDSTLKALVLSGWMHWWDSVDVLVEGEGMRVRVAFHALAQEQRIYEEQLRFIAETNGAGIAFEGVLACVGDGLPDLVLKTTPDRVVGLARVLASEGVRCVALYYSGVVHGFFPAEWREPAARALQLGGALAQELEAEGGDWHSRHGVAGPPRAAEAAWVRALEETIVAS